MQSAAESLKVGAMLRPGVIAAGVAVAVFLIAPRAAPFLLLAMVLPAAALALPGRVARTDLGPLLVAALAFAAYLLLNSLWSQHRLDAFGKSLLFIVLFAALWLSRRGLARLPDDMLEHLVRVTLVAFAVALAFLVLEEVTQHAIKRALFNVLPVARPNEKHIQLESGIVANIYLYVSNRSMAALTLVVWPILLMTAITVTHSRRWLIIGAIVAATVLAIGMSQHETSAIALILSVIAAGLAFHMRRLAMALVAGAWIVSTLLVVPIVAEAYAQKLHMAQWLPITARQRIIIWGFTAEQISKAPLLGIGIGSGKVLDARHTPETPPGYVYARRAGTHSHNVYLQTWYELGAIGAVLLCALGLAIVRAIGRLDAPAQPTALATFGAAAAIAAFSWGMWQPWFMAAFAVAALMTLVATELARRRTTTGGGLGGGS